ncbi:hypothetical protein F5Y18DRAFT_426708 [Xylariaceae sp. FL1019]|nr:hypothetical protein F5Y18DRAFT_426708 [Xylariaceae sp. FL1019]
MVQLTSLVALIAVAATGVSATCTTPCTAGVDYCGYFLLQNLGCATSDLQSTPPGVSSFDSLYICNPNNVTATYVEYCGTGEVGTIFTRLVNQAFGLNPRL